MRKFFIISLILSVNIIAQSQVTKQIQIPLYDNVETSYSFKQIQDRTKQLHLPTLATNTDNYHFRFWTGEQIVDIWSSDNKIFHGQIINYISKFEYKKRQRYWRIISEKITIDTAESEKIHELVKTISSIPSKSSIEGWILWRDSQVNYVFETSTPNCYTYKEYDCANIQDSSLIEAKLISAYIDSIYSQLKLKVKYEHFVESLKYGYYMNDNFNTTYKISKKRLKEFEKNKPNADYLNSIIDSLGNYLSDTLTKIFRFNNDSLFSNEFYLIFSKKNRLKKIETFDSFEDYADRIDFMRSKKRIRKAFRQIDINFVHSKKEYWIKINYYNETKEVIID